MKELFSNCEFEILRLTPPGVRISGKLLEPFISYNYTTLLRALKKLERNGYLIVIENSRFKVYLLTKKGIEKRLWEN